MSSFVDDEYSKMRSKGNEFFVQGNFAQAEDIYTEILQKFDNDTSIILTNRSAARLSLGKVNDALYDAEKAIEADRKWMKAYYRKASALEILKRHKDVFETWMEAAAQCGADTSPWLSKQLRLARANWAKNFRDVPITDIEDFITRYEMLNDSREKLSTMAHFWNDSTLPERVHHFRFLLSLIGNGNDPSMQTKDITEANMPEMPLHNYEDLTRATIACWCDFFVSLSSELKTTVMERMWLTLSDEEQGAVITDLRQFIFFAVKSESDAQVAACRRAAPMS